jgi:hypothetical protein
LASVLVGWLVGWREGCFVDGPGERPQVAVLEVEAELGSGLLFGQAVPADTLYLRQGEVEWGGFGLAGFEVEAIFGDAGETPVVG